MIKRFLIFIILNFNALALGGFFTGTGVSSEWYAALNKAPWTPPGWVFGAAWTLIMVCFAVYMAALITNKKDQKEDVLILFAIQWVLNVFWNPVFFYWNQIVVAALVILGLTVLVSYMLFQYRKDLGFKTLLILPYAVWLVIASSLNVYILLFN